MDKDLFLKHDKKSEYKCDSRSCDSGFFWLMLLTPLSTIL